MNNRLFPLAAFAALAFNLYAGFSFIENAAPTFDEPAHLASGHLYLKTGSYAAGPLINAHPPLAEMAAALPLLPLGLRTFTDSPFFSPGGRFCWANAFVYDNKAPADKIVNTARRFSFLIWTALAAAFIFLLALKTDCAAAAFLSIFLYSFTPAFISGNALVMTDAAPAAFYAGTVFCAFMFSRGLAGGQTPAAAKLWLAAAALTSALAMASKFSMAFLPVFTAALWILDLLAAGALKRNAGRLALSILAYWAATALLVAAVYRFSQADLYAGALFSTSKWLRLERASFVNGVYFPGGVWWYFPYAFLIQTPLSLLVLSVCGLAYSLIKRENRHLWIYAPAVFYLGLALASKLQIGYRHLLPVMPFVIVAAAVGLNRLVSGKYTRIAALGLAVWLVFSVARAGPYYLSYFNEAAGGPRKSWKRLAESSAGQDLKPLAEYLKREGNPPVYLAYFGGARPEYYGIKYIPLVTDAEKPCFYTRENPAAFKRQLAAVSATNLLGIYITDKKFFRWLAERKPVYKAGNTIFVYDLSGDREGILKIAETLHKQKMEDYAARVRALALAETPRAGPAGPGTVSALVFSPDGKRLAWADTMKGLHIAAADAGTALKTIRLDFSASSLAFSPDSSRILAGCLDGALRIIRASDGFLLGGLKAHEWDIPALAVSPDGKYLASGSIDGKIKLWRAPDLKLLKSMAAPAKPVYFLSFSGGGRLISADFDGFIASWDTKTGDRAPFFRAEPGYALNAAAVSPDSRYMAYGGYGRRLRILDLAGRRPVCERADFKGSIQALAFSPDAKLLAAATSRGEIKLTSLPDCRKAGAPEYGKPGAIYAAAFSPDGGLVAAGGEGGRISVRLSIQNENN